MKVLLGLFGLGIVFSVFSSEVTKFRPQGTVYQGANFSGKDFLCSKSRVHVDQRSSLCFPQPEDFIRLIKALEQRVEQLEKTQQNLDRSHQGQKVITLKAIQEEIARFCQESKFISEDVTFRQSVEQQSDTQKLSKSVISLQQQVSELSSKYQEVELLVRILYANSLSLREEFLKYMSQKEEEERKKKEEDSALGGKIRDVAYQVTVLQLRFDDQIKALQGEINALSKKKLDDDAEVSRLDFSSATRPSSHRHTPENESNSPLYFSLDELRVFRPAEDASFRSPRSIWPLPGPVSIPSTPAESQVGTDGKDQKLKKERSPDMPTGDEDWKERSPDMPTGDEDWVEF